MATVLDSSADQSQNSPRVNADTPAGIADLFNRYFASVLTIDSAVEKTACIRSNTVISAALKALEVGKATGPDEIPAKLLKETASVIAPSLCKIFNKSLQLRSLPSDWKLANVVPVHKKGAKDHVENYRPISLLPIVSKVFERCVLNCIKGHLYHTKIFREIKTLDDALSLQKDLGKLATWSYSSGLLFHEATCKAQRITRKKTRSYLLTNSTTPHLNYMLQKKIWAYGLVRI